MRTVFDGCDLADGWYYMVTAGATGALRVARGVIVEAPPIWRYVVGQPARATLMAMAVRFDRMRDDAPSLR